MTGYLTTCVYFQRPRPQAILEISIHNRETRSFPEEIKKNPAASYPPMSPLALIPPLHSCILIMEYYEYRKRNEGHAWRKIGTRVGSGNEWIKGMEKTETKTLNPFLFPPLSLSKDLNEQKINSSHSFIYLANQSNKITLL